MKDEMIKGHRCHHLTKFLPPIFGLQELVKVTKLKFHNSWNMRKLQNTRLYKTHRKLKTTDDRKELNTGVVRLKVVVVEV